MLAINQIEFENVAIETPQDLADLRASGKLPFDQMPLLEISGLNLSQSTAMIRYLARLGDLYGDSDTDAVWCDMIAGAVADTRRPKPGISSSKYQSLLSRLKPGKEQFVRDKKLPRAD